MLLINVMEPLSPQDPLHHLLGKAKTVEPRTNFTQNVMRAVRQVPQHQSVWSRVSDWFFEAPHKLSYAAGSLATVGIVALCMFLFSTIGTIPNQTVGVKPTATQSTQALALAYQQDMGTAQDFAADLDSTNPLTELLAQQESITLSDSDIGLLLY